MDVAGTEIGSKMRSAIKAKLTELGCYVDDELPDYVMVMVANKRTRSQMNDDLSLFLGNNTQMFVNWLHQVLKKLQEVSVSTALAPPEKEVAKPAKTRASSKDKKDKLKVKKSKKDVKDKHKKKTDLVKKSKKDKRDKKDKKLKKGKGKKDKSKKKKKPDEVIRLNVPPLFMNPEKDSEPSITDVFAGQILKNHGISIEKTKIEDTPADVKPARKALNRNKFVIDPATVTNVTDLPNAQTANSESNKSTTENAENSTELSGEPIQLAAQRAMAELEKMPREEQIREMNEIEAKIQGLKRKLADQMETLSEDEDFLNIRTEAEELMNDFAEDVLQEISSAQEQASALPAPAPSSPSPAPSPAPAPATPPSPPRAPPSPPPQLQHIELILPKRPMRERLGVRLERTERREDVITLSNNHTAAEEQPKEKPKEREKITFDKTRDREERDRDRERDKDRERRRHVALPDRGDDDEDRYKSSSGRSGPASVVRVRPRPRPTPASAPALLMRAVADAHKSLLNVAPKPEKEPQVKRALVMPMRRTIDAENIVIQVHRGTDTTNVAEAESQEGSDCEIDLDTESLTDLADTTDTYKPTEYVPEPLRRDCLNAGLKKYATSHTSDSSTYEDDVLKIHNKTKDQKGPQFVVTLDGLDPNIFLAKKLKTEGLADEIEIDIKTPKTNAGQKNNAKMIAEKIDLKPIENDKLSDKITKLTSQANKTVSERIKPDVEITKSIVETTKSVRKDNEKPIKKTVDNAAAKPSDVEPPTRKRRASPIVFDMKDKERAREQKREKETKRERKESGDSDITVTTASSHKYDAIPPLSATPVAAGSSRPLCRSFPACRFGAACLFRHPPCELPACARRDCVYSHPPHLASHVVPVGTYKSIVAPVTATPPLCKYYPGCANPACAFLHPRPCRYGAACLNRRQCNFYHNDSPALKWKGVG